MVGVRFDNISDLNLFLFNKSRHQSEQTLGTLRRVVSFLTLVSDDEGFFRLQAHTKNPILQEQQTQFGFSVRPMNPGDTADTCNGDLHLLFKSKLKLMKFFVSKIGKQINILRFDENFIVEEVTRVENRVTSLQMEVQKCQAYVERMQKKVDNFKELIRTETDLLQSKMIKMNTLKMQLSLSQEKIHNSCNCGNSEVRISLDTILGYRFKDETRLSDNYPRCLTSFFRSPGIVRVEAEDETIFVVFKTQSSLQQTCRRLCTTLQGPKRAELIPDPLCGDYRLLIYLVESDLRNIPLEELEEFVRKRGGDTEVWKFGLRVRFADKLSLVNCLASSEVYKYHKTVIQNDSILYYGGSLSSFTFNGLPCLFEDDLVRLNFGEDESEACSTLTDFIRESGFNSVRLDWDGDLVFTFSKEGALEKTLSKFGGLAKGPKKFSFSDDLLLRVPPRTDVRDYLALVDSCQMNKGFISFRHKRDLIECLVSEPLKALYPDAVLHKQSLTLH